MASMGKHDSNNGNNNNSIPAHDELGMREANLVKAIYYEQGKHALLSFVQVCAYIFHHVL